MGARSAATRLSAKDCVSMPEPALSDLTMFAAVLAALFLDPALGRAVGELADEETELVVAMVLGAFT